MRSRLLALPATAVALLLGAGAATASASTTQTVGQAALNGQLAVSLANAAQRGAVNASTPLSLLSPGHSAGSTGQFNGSSANSAAGNANRTLQSVVQSGLGSGGAAVQGAGQQAGNAQGAISAATSTQVGATNRNLPIRILSPGGSTGSVGQGNSSEANSGAGNRNETIQSVGQGLGGSGGAGLGAEQAAGQSAGSFQLAGSAASSTQTEPSNVNVPIRILSPGSDTGSVRQGNNSSAYSGAGNANRTQQTVTQSGGGGLLAGLGIQAAGQSANNGQAAGSEATSTQTHPSNVNVPIRILSPGSDTGSVTQFNGSSANSAAGNANSTNQSVDQAQGGLLAGLGVQAAGQSANNGQIAGSEASSTQTDPSNVNVPIRILSPGSDTGSVTQFNGSSANSAAGNANSTGQSVMQLGGFEL